MLTIEQVHLRLRELHCQAWGHPWPLFPMRIRNQRGLCTTILGSGFVRYCHHSKARDDYAALLFSSWVDLSCMPCSSQGSTKLVSALLIGLTTLKLYASLWCFWIWMMTLQRKGVEHEKHGKLALNDRSICGGSSHEAKVS